MTIAFYGQWDETVEWLTKLEVDGGVDDYEDAMEDLGKAVKSRAIWKIKRGDPTWTPLSKTTVDKKGHDKPYIDERMYMDNIEVSTKKKGKKILTRIYPSGKNRRGFDYQLIARWLEFGLTSGPASIPERPLWRPLLKRVKNIPQYRNLVRSIKARGKS